VGKLNDHNEPEGRHSFWTILRSATSTAAASTYEHLRMVSYTALRAQAVFFGYPRLTRVG